MQIKYFATRLVIVIFSSLFYIQADAQCTPDTAGKAPGTHPKILDTAFVDVAYSQTISAIIPPDTTGDLNGNTINADINYIQMLDVIGLPTGFTWACNPSNCKYPGDSIGCLIITGTPSQNQIGEYPLTIPVNANITEKTLKLTFNQPDTITMYSLFVKNGSTSIRETEQNQIVFFPNPAKGNFVITINNNKIEQKEIEIMDIRGKVLFNTIITSSGNQHLTVSDLSDGIYFLSIKNGTHRRTEKLVIIN